MIGEFPITYGEYIYQPAELYYIGIRPVEFVRLRAAISAACDESHPDLQRQRVRELRDVMARTQLHVTR
jgi:hypothetical protein